MEVQLKLSSTSISALLFVQEPIHTWKSSAPKFLAMILTQLVGALALQSCAPGNPDILRMVMEAKTPADHDAIASYYEKQPAKNEAQAASHRELAATYRQFHNTNKNMMAPHCEIMADSYAKIAAEDSALAQGHRKLAQSAK